ncbi:hypothetical protein NPIL_417481 [Nephila pilipes]|uniref:Uncharacterized protein n=1 Tax=Nephila pilipes TaxID=299642 RepID=A0A8X6MS31_NEPPI|nr:hypothetical protein NPIL_417481 [Nephila pilipes]
MARPWPGIVAKHGTKASSVSWAMMNKMAAWLGYQPMSGGSFTAGNRKEQHTRHILRTLECAKFTSGLFYFTFFTTGEPYGSRRFYRQRSECGSSIPPAHFAKLSAGLAYCKGIIYGLFYPTGRPKQYLKGEAQLLKPNNLPQPRPSFLLAGFTCYFAICHAKTDGSFSQPLNLAIVILKRQPVRVALSI